MTDKVALMSKEPTKEPGYFGSEEYMNRRRKLQELRDLGIDPYPHHFTPTSGLEALASEHSEAPLGGSEDAASGSTPEAKVAGRLVLFRAMGKNAFAHIQDETGRLQLMFNRDITRVSGYEGDSAGKPIKIVEKKFDLGDIVGVQGHLFRTQKGELTLFVHEVTLLCKSLLPLPDKHAGLADKELRYRKRWLDLISHQDVAATFRTRSRIMGIIRDYMQELRFLEVETPVLQSLYGGAEARPFETELHALQQHMFLRISLELPLKKLLVGGVERVFEIGKVFRNEGIDRTHNPEFSLLEAYAAYWDYNDMMVFVEKLYEKVALELFGSTLVPVNQELSIDVKAPWPRLSMKGSLKQHADLDVDTLSDEQMRERLLKLEAGSPGELKDTPRGLLIGKLFEELVEPKLIQPVHIIDHPRETTPLCKGHRDPEEAREGLVERFESFINCQEACNAYSELNDPVLQRQLLEGQAAKRAAGDAEANPMDEEFLEAICQGMPPAGGVGIGIDRLVMLFTQAQSIRDVLYFPWMKPDSDLGL